MNEAKFIKIRWLKAALLAVSLLMINTAAQAANPVTGKPLYNRHCSNCHGSNGVATIPGLPDFSRGEAMLQPDSRLKATILNGGGMMPAYRGAMTELQILDVIAYLRTLRR